MYGQPQYGAPPPQYGQPQYAQQQQPQYGAPPPQQYAQQPQYAPQYGQPPPQQQQFYAPPPPPVQQQPQYYPAAPAGAAPSYVPGPPAPVLDSAAYATLSFLTQTPGLLVRQNVNMGDVQLAALGVGGDWQGNKYDVKPCPPGYDALNDTLDDQAYRSLPTYFLALEESDLCARKLCGSYRGLVLHLKDASGTEVLRCKRPFACTLLCGLPACCFTYLNPQTMEIITMAPGGMEGPKLGSVRQTSSCCSLSNRLEVLDAADHVIYVLSAYSLQCGPNCCCHEFEFKIETPDGTHTGASIKNVFPGCNFRGMCTRADNLQVAFPTTASPEHRAILLGSAFMLDYLFFEQGGRVCCGGDDK